MSEPTRDDIKKAADWCVNGTTCLGCPSDLTSTAFCRERFARAYLALREQVETVALPALQAGREAMRERRLYGDAWERKYDEKWNDEDAQVDAAIKAIEEGKG